MTAEQRFDDVYEQGKLFEQMTSRVKAVTSSVMDQVAVDQFTFITEKTDELERLLRWRVIWDIKDFDKRIEGKQTEIYLRFPTIATCQNQPYFAARISQKIRNQWQDKLVSTENLSEEGLAGLLSHAIQHPLRFSKVRGFPIQNLGCPAGCAASQDRFLTSFYAFRRNLSPKN